MCWIAFGNAEFVAKTFDVQDDRGTDGVGVVDAFGNHAFGYLRDDMISFDLVRKRDGNERKDYFCFHDKEKKPIKYKLKDEFYTTFLQTYLPMFKSDNVLLHHRKGSVGTKGIENVHPYVGEKFSLLQNGTDHSLHSWWILEGYDKDKSDSYMLLQYVERHADTLEEAAACLEKTKDEVCFGVVVITDRHGRLLYFSDGERSCSFEFHGDKVAWFRSKRSMMSAEEITVGHLIMDFDGNVIENALKKLNEPKPSKALATSSYSHHDYYSDWESGTVLGSVFGSSDKDKKKKKEEPKKKKDKGDKYYGEYWKSYDAEDYFEDYFWSDEEVDKLSDKLLKYSENMTTTEFQQYCDDYQRFYELFEKAMMDVKTTLTVSATFDEEEYLELYVQAQDYVKSFAPQLLINSPKG